MKTFYALHSYRSILILFLFGTFLTQAQEDSKILDTYEDYTEAAREITYLHLNKSTYVKGEDIGFTAYVLDKKDKKPSLLTTNLYVSIEDKNKNIIKQKLIRVFDGVASNTFEVDSLFTSGNYKIKAYTNWMLNFNEKNYYSESIKIIDLDNEDEIQEKRIDNKIDAQFLPESGHLLNGVVNIIGVVIKDHLGYGIPNAKGELVDKNNDVLTSFETNQFGIGKFQLLPELGNLYTVKINNANEDFSINLNQKIEEEGIILSLKSLNSKVFVSLITNKKTLETIKNKRHTLMIHNGDNYDIMDVYFTDKTEVTKAIDYSNTATGINILTLFNDNDQPIAERLFFNHQGINIIKSNNVSAEKTKDSVTINLNFKGVESSDYNSISISVLPEETKSYNRHHNIISYTYLEPYVNGTIEQAKYYFTNIDAKKKYELDNLLITQGWSSYNWNEIFNNAPNQTYAFEQGITVKANLTSKDIDDKSDYNYLMHAVNNEGPRTFTVKKNDETFVIENLFPDGTNEINLSKTTQTKGLLPATLYLQYFPNAIPHLNDKNTLLPPKPDYNILDTENSYNSNTILRKINGMQKLDEVVVTSKLSDIRQRKDELSSNRLGRVTVINEQDRTTFVALLDYLKYRILTESTRYKDTNDSSFKIERYTINYFLDDMLLPDKSFLQGIYLSDIEFIEYDRFGITEGLRSPNGAIKIYSKKTLTSGPNKETSKAYKFPLAFSPNKKYYTPKYRYSHDDFFKKFGAIVWNPQLHTDENGNVNLKIASPSIPITLHIEGITNDGYFIFEEKTIGLN